MRKPLHVLLLDFFSSFGGTEFYNYNLICGLIDRGVEVTVFIGERPENDYWINQLRQRNIQVSFPDEFHKSLNDRTIELRFSRHICKSLGQLKPDIIFAHPMGKLLISCMDNNIDHIPIVATDYTTADDNTQHWYQPDLKKHINSIDTIISKCEREEISLRNFLNYNGIIERIPHLIPRVSKCSDDVDDPFSVGCILRLSPEKGLDYLLGAWKNVNEYIPFSTLHIYGHGKYEEYYKELCDCLGISKTVHFEGTYKPIVGLDEIVCRHGLFVQPSLFESIPTALIELLLRNRIVIATNVGGVSEIIPVNSGFLVSTASTDQLSDKIIKVLNRDTSLQWNNDIFSNVKKIYNFDENIEKIISVFKKVVSK